MVKALVFGTKDLCVRIAPWSILNLLRDNFFLGLGIWEGLTIFLVGGGCMRVFVKGGVVVGGFVGFLGRFCGGLAALSDNDKIVPAA